MAITELDVHAAADALLARRRTSHHRARPAEAGQGSPNTITGFLNTWFAALGERLTGARDASLPEPVQGRRRTCGERRWKKRGSWPWHARANRPTAWRRSAKGWLRSKANSHRARPGCKPVKRTWNWACRRCASNWQPCRTRPPSASTRLQAEQQQLASARGAPRAGAWGDGSLARPGRRRAQARHADALAEAQARHAAQERRWLNELDAERQATKRLGAELDRTRQQAERERQAAERERETAERERQVAEQERQSAVQERAKPRPWSGSCKTNCARPCAPKPCCVPNCRRRRRGWKQVRRPRMRAKRRPSSAKPTCCARSRRSRRNWRRKTSSLITGPGRSRHAAPRGEATRRSRPENKAQPYLSRGAAGRTPASLAPLAWTASASICWQSRETGPRPSPPSSTRSGNPLKHGYANAASDWRNSTPARPDPIHGARMRRLSSRRKIQHGRRRRVHNRASASSRVTRNATTATGSVAPRKTNKMETCMGPSWKLKYLWPPRRPSPA